MTAASEVLGPIETLRGVLPPIEPIARIDGGWLTIPSIEVWTTRVAVHCVWEGAPPEAGRGILIRDDHATPYVLEAAVSLQHSTWLDEQYVFGPTVPDGVAMMTVWSPLIDPFVGISVRDRQLREVLSPAPPASPDRTDYGRPRKFVQMFGVDIDHYDRALPALEAAGFSILDTAHFSQSQSLSPMARLVVLKTIYDGPRNLVIEGEAEARAVGVLEAFGMVMQKGEPVSAWDDE